MRKFKTKSKEKREKRKGKEGGGDSIKTGVDYGGEQRAERVSARRTLESPMKISLLATTF